MARRRVQKKKKKKPVFLMGCLISFMVLFILPVSCIFITDVSKKSQRRAVLSNVDLPTHKFQVARDSESRSQIRAIVPLKSMSENDLRNMAVYLAMSHDDEVDTHAYLVQFFSDESCLVNWDGSGLLRDSDWPYWMCRIAVNEESAGELKVRSFKLATDEKSGQPRTDVLK